METLDRSLDLRNRGFIDLDLPSYKIDQHGPCNIDPASYAGTAPLSRGTPEMVPILPFGGGDLDWTYSLTRKKNLQGIEAAVFDTSQGSNPQLQKRIFAIDLG